MAQNLLTPNPVGSIKSIQRGIISSVGTAATNTATISSVDVNKCELRYLGYLSNNSGAYETVFGSLLSLTNSTTITASFRNPNGYSASISWELTEYY